MASLYQETLLNLPAGCHCWLVQQCEAGTRVPLLDEPAVAHVTHLIEKITVAPLGVTEFQHKPARNTRKAGPSPELSSHRLLRP
jgi:hypothetical protein